MDWNLKHGRHLKFYLDLEKEGKNVKALDSRPEIYEDLIPVWEAFKVLSKTQGQNIQEIKTYLELMEITDNEEKEDYFFYLTNLIEKRIEHGSKTNGT